MSDLVNYVATSGGHAYFGMAEDPAAEIARMQAGTPHPIFLLAGWVLTPKRRADLLDALTRALRTTPRRGEWFVMDETIAKVTLRRCAMELGGRRWEPRRRPRPDETMPRGRARAVMTPNGLYPSAQEAGDAYGISRQAAWERADRRSPGWRFEGDDRPAPVRASPGQPPKVSAAE